MYIILVVPIDPLELKDIFGIENINYEYNL